MEALGRREWPRTEAENHRLAFAMFAARAIALDMEKAGCGDEIEKIGRAILHDALFPPEAANGEDGQRQVRASPPGKVSPAAESSS